MDKTAARFPMCFVVPSIFCRFRRFDLVRRSILDMPPRNFFRRLRARIVAASHGLRPTVICRRFAGKLRDKKATSSLIA